MKVCPAVGQLVALPRLTPPLPPHSVNNLPANHSPTLLVGFSLFLYLLFCIFFSPLRKLGKETSFYSFKFIFLS